MEAPARPRLLIVVNVFAPDRGGGAAVFTDLAHGLAERGFDVTVRCAYPYYPEWKDKSGDNGLRVAREQVGDITVERFGLFIPRNPNSLPQRLLYEASFFASVSRALRRDRARFDATMVFCPLVGAVGYAAARKRLFGGPLWLNVQDLAAEAAAAGGITRGKRTGDVFRRIQNSLFNLADVWSSISPEMVDRLAPARKHDQPILYLPNWLNQSVSDVLAELKSKVGRDASDPIHLLYAGNIGTKQDLRKFCEALSESATPFRFKIHGSGGRADDLCEWVSARGDDRFEFGPFLSEADFVRAIHASDLFVITETAGSGGSFIPSKLIPAIATGTPIMAVSDDESPLGREVIANGLGPHIPWNRLGQVPALLEGTRSNPENLHSWQQAALDRSRFYDRDRVIGEFDSALRRMIAGEPLRDDA